MTRQTARRSTVVVIAMVGMACAGDREPAPDSAVAISTAAKQDSATASIAAPDSSASPKTNAAPPCVSEGAWQTCSVEKRLTDAGFVPQKQDAPAADLFAVRGTEYGLGPARLHVYVFATAKEREAAVAGIDTIAIARRGKPATWPAPAWLITSNNLVAVLVSDNARLVERVQLAITAGLPSATH